MISIPVPVMKLANKAGSWLVKNGPKIMSVAGGAMAVGGAVMACKATLKVDAVLDEHKSRMARIEAAKAISDDFGDNQITDKDVRRAKFETYVHTGVEVVKLYGPAVCVGMSGVGLMQGAYHIMENRHSTTLAALTAMDQAYNELAARYNAENDVPAHTLPVEKKERVVPLLKSGDEETDEAAELVLEDYIPVEMFDILENDPYTIVYDSRNEDWYDGGCFVLNASQIESNFRLFEKDRSSYNRPVVWVNDIRRVFKKEEKALGWSHGWTSEPGDTIEYEIYPFVYDKIDGMIVGMSGVPGATNEERIEQLRAIEMTEGPDDYCVVISLRGNSENGTPRYIRNEVFGK